MVWYAFYRCYAILQSIFSPYLCTVIGIGRIGIVDADVVDLSNLQRQVIHFTKDVGVPKVKSAEEKIKAINPDVPSPPHRTARTVVPLHRR